MQTASSAPPPPCRRHLTFLVHRTCFVHPGKRHLGKRRDCLGQVGIRNRPHSSQRLKRDQGLPFLFLEQVGMNTGVPQNWDARLPFQAMKASLPLAARCRRSQTQAHSPHGFTCAGPEAQPHLLCGEPRWSRRSFDSKITMPVTAAGVGGFSVKKAELSVRSSFWVW